MANPVGRPLLFKTVEELQDKIEEYFVYCDNKTKDIHSDKLGDMIVPDPQPYGMAGLAYELGISRQTLINYENKDEFLDTIKRARARVEADIERRLSSKDLFTPGLIFNATNNLGWVNKTEVDTNLNGTVQVDVGGVLNKVYGDKPTTPGEMPASR